MDRYDGNIVILKQEKASTVLACFRVVSTPLVARRESKELHNERATFVGDQRMLLVVKYGRSIAVAL